MVGPPRVELGLRVPETPWAHFLSRDITKTNKNNNLINTFGVHFSPF